MQENTIEPYPQHELNPTKSHKKKSEFLGEYLKEMLPIKCGDIDPMIKELSVHGIVLVEGFVEGLRKIVKKKEGNSI